MVDAVREIHLNDHTFTYAQINTNDNSTFQTPIFQFTHILVFKMDRKISYSK